MNDEDGFADFVVARSRSLLRFAWILTGDWGMAEDLVQSALLNTWLKWSSIRHTEDPDVYVRRVMINTRTTWWRRRWRGETPAADLPVGPSYGDDFARADERNALHQALAYLPPRQRAVVALRFLDDLPESTVASVLGCSVGTVKSQAAKALAKLREQPGLRETFDRVVPR